MTVGGGHISLYAEGLLVRFVEIELVTGAYFNAQIAVSARGEIVNGWIVLAVEAQHAGRADTNAGTTSMAEPSIYDLCESSQRSWSFIFPIFVPLKGVVKTAPLTELGIRRWIRKYSQ
jgi:hypothetical protein